MWGFFGKTLFRFLRGANGASSGGTPDEGSPGPKQSTGLISGSPSCVSLRIMPERAEQARSGGIPRLLSRLVGSAPETPAAF